MSAPRRRQQAGMGAVVAIVILVMLSSLAAGLVRLSWTAETSSGADILAARARQAAKAGLEWGLFQALRGTWTACTSATQTLDLRSQTGMWVTITCTGNSYVEGADSGSNARVVRITNIEAVACNGTATCPDNASAANLGYVERRQRTSVSDVSTLP
jgi:MSHA biogenesis protein MshP